ncbi:MAG TPA: SLC13 family permease [Desulfobacterales bacterium]
MTPEIALVFFILAVSVILLVSEWIPMEVTALLVLGTLAITGLVTPIESLSGFSSPAVVTVWAVFILSGGLTQTGVANIIGRYVRKMAGTRESVMIAVIMISAGVMSALMNNVAVAALMLPVVMDLARHTGTAPSRLLMPLAYGSLLGGLTTQIGTPPNILVTDALRNSGMEPFTFFDFTPVGLVIMAAGVAYMVLVGRHLLPRKDVARESSQRRSRDWKSGYELGERLFYVRVPKDSILIGKTLTQLRLRSTLGMNVIGITRGDRTLLAPGPADTLQPGDRLTVEGRLADLREVRNWSELAMEAPAVDVDSVTAGDLGLAEVVLREASKYSGKTLVDLDFRNRFQAIVLAVANGNGIRRTNLQDVTLRGGDRLLIQGRPEALAAVREHSEFETFREVSSDVLAETYALQERLLAMRVPPDSALVGTTLKDSRLGNATGMRVLGIRREDGTTVMPEPSEVLQAGDCLIVEGSRENLTVLYSLNELEIDRQQTPNLEKLIQGDSGLVEAILAPRTPLEGKTLRQLDFREKYGLNVLAIWRRGKAHYSDLRDMALQFGDALLLLGPREKLNLLGREPDFIVLTETAQAPLRIEKAKISSLLMAAVLVPVVMGWVPIYISAVVGAALMVLSGCLTMEEAYRQIEWKAVFLISGMLPLGTALDQTGAAQFIAETVVAQAGPYGPQAIMIGLVSLTFLATCFVPTAALVVLMAPIVLNTSADLGLSPYSLMMAIAMAASASFTTPIAHPANILVMGPGGYRFLDYLKVGGSLTLVILVVIALVLPMLWPLQ